MANGIGLTEGLNLFLRDQQLQQGKAELGLRRDQLEQMKQQAIAQKAKEDFEMEGSVFDNAMKMGPLGIDLAIESMNKQAKMAGLPELSHLVDPEKKKEAAQDYSKFRVAFSKNPQMDPEPFLRQFYGKYGGLAELTKMKAQAEETTIERMEMQQADQLISERLGDTTTIQERVNALDEMARTDEDPKIRTRASSLLDTIEKQKGILPVSSSAKGVTTPELSLRAAQGDKDALKALELMSPKDRTISFVELALSAAKGDEMAMKAMKLITESKDSPVMAMLRKSIENIEKQSPEGTSDADLLKQIADELTKGQGTLK